ncbi:MAG: hypothetical protein AAFY27_00500 [Pseudomonadota bacterium]
MPQLLVGCFNFLPTNIDRCVEFFLPGTTALDDNRWNVSPPDEPVGPATAKHMSKSHVRSPLLHDRLGIPDAVCTASVS